MRIRKRYHLLSSLSSDPPVNNQSSIVQVQQVQNDEYSKFQCKPDLPNQTTSDGQLTEKTTWVSQANDFLSSSKDLEVEEANDGKKIVEEEDGKEKKTSINDIIIRKECTLNKEVNISSLAPFSSPFDKDGLVVPLKKRKRSYKRSTQDDDQYSNSEWKSKTNKKSTMFQDDDNLHLLAKTTEVYVGDVIGNSSSTSKRKKIRGSVLLEGSRCSRINGRGWRCCQPTLVGYSLCEHHLGKGRLRTIMSTVTVRNQNQNQKQPMGTSAIAPKYYDGEQTQAQPSLFKGINQEKIVGEDNVNRYNNNNDNDDELPRVELNKMKKLGKVRARSMSSLLVAIDNATMAASQQPPK
ncbi:hypothetical protein Leryth_019401 [Lithospermum erythrorhizon]|nr:hypothetical protein Leryth_019401 [Lithospermum erythrorhizon]